MKWRGVLGFLPLFLNSIAQADSAPNAWGQNCLSRYEAIDITPLLPSLLPELSSPENRPDVRELLDKLRNLLQKQAALKTPTWNSTETQDLGRDVQEFLFRQKADPSLDVLRSHWILLILAQHQWDIVLPALRKREDIANEKWRNLAVWQEAEARLGQNEFADAARLFDQNLKPEPALATWLILRKMETQFLLGQSEAALNQLKNVLHSNLLEGQGSAVILEQLNLFLQAFSVKGQAIPPLFNILAEENRDNLLSLAATCTLKTSTNLQNRALALTFLLGIKKPNAFTLLTAGTHIEKLLIEPALVESNLSFLSSYAAHAQRLFSSTPAAEIAKEDIFHFVQTFVKAGEFFLKSRTLQESMPLLDRLEQAIFQADSAIPASYSQDDLRTLRARVLERSHRYGDAAAVYKEMALSARSPALQRKYADLMLQSFGLASTQSSSLIPSQISPNPTPVASNQDAFLDACSVYQKLVPEASQELSRCDLMQARQALQKGEPGDARQKLWQIVYAFPNAVEGQTAAERLLEIAGNNPDELYLTSENLLKMRAYQTGPWGLKLRETRRQSAYQRITALASPDDQSEAYFFYAQKEKGTRLADQSLLASVRLDQESGRLSRAMDRLEIWLQDYPDSSTADAKLLDLVSIAEKSLQLKRARQYLKWTEGKTWTTAQNDFLLQKACTFDIIENPLLALTSCQKLPEHLPEGPKLRLQLARALAYGGFSEQLNLYAKDKLMPRNDFKVDDKIEILDLLRKAESITPHRRDDIKTTMTNYYLEQTDQLGPHSRRVLGSLAYQSAQRSLLAFQSMPIHGTRSDELISAIQGKKQAFDELEALYNKVLQTKDPHWGSSALCDLALAAESFGEALQKIPEIEGLDRKKLMSQITSQVGAWKAKAKSFAGAASKTIEKYGTLHYDNRRIIQEAHRLKDDSILWNDWLPPIEVDHVAY